MTEEEWLSSDNPEAMLAAVRAGRGPTGRKLRLFLCACCRHIPQLMDDESVRNVVEASERYAEGEATTSELSRAFGRASRRWGAAIAITPAKAERARSTLCRVATHGAAERRYQCRLLRDIFGNPFRKTPVDARWLTANVVILARLVYLHRAFDRLPILSDALMDAGCDGEEILGHCRSAGPHVRGCWVLDLLLQKS